MANLRLTITISYMTVVNLMPAFRLFTFFDDANSNMRIENYKSAARLKIWLWLDNFRWSSLRTRTSFGWTSISALSKTTQPSNHSCPKFRALKSCRSPTTWWTRSRMASGASKGCWPCMGWTSQTVHWYQAQNWKSQWKINNIIKFIFIRTNDTSYNMSYK